MITPRKKPSMESEVFSEWTDYTHCESVSWYDMIWYRWPADLHRWEGPYLQLVYKHILQSKTIFLFLFYGESQYGIWEATWTTHSVMHLYSAFTWRPQSPLKQSVVLSWLGVTLCCPIPLGRNTTPEGKHVHWSEFKMLNATKSKLL